VGTSPVRQADRACYRRPDQPLHQPPDRPAARDYPTGAWQPGESRDYHVALDVTPGEPNAPVQACRVSAVLTEPGGTTRELAGEAIQVEWTGFKP
jgi:hypothetical protein